MLSQKKQILHNFSFRPHWSLTLAAVALVLLTARLSVWQFSRAEEKSQLEHAAQQAMQQAPTALAALVQDNTLAPFQRIRASGWYDTEHEILLDNRIHQGQAGYHVLTPFIFAMNESAFDSESASDSGGDYKIAMVNRGWLRGGARRADAPAIPAPPSGKQTLQGITMRDSSDAFLLSDNTVQGNIHQNLNLAEFGAARSLDLLPVLIVAEAAAVSESTAAESTNESGAPQLLPAPVRTDYKSQRSLVYAWQWLTFALLTIVFYIVLGLKKTQMKFEKRK